MAYNVLKGTVEGSVDQHGNQNIGGTKVFKNAVSASAFYDVSAESPCATLKDVPVRKITGGSEGCVLVFQGNAIARAETLLTFRDKELITRTVRADKFIGSGELLTQLPSDQFTKAIRARHIAHSHGLRDVRGNLQVKTAEGLRVNENGVGIDLNSSCALSIVNKKLTVDPARSKNIHSEGHNLSDSDLLLVSDVSRQGTYHTTLQNLYENYIKIKTPSPAGAPSQLQIKAPNGFAATPALSYDTQKNLLNVGGQTKTIDLVVEESIKCNGAVIKNIKMITDSDYEVSADDYTILCDTNAHSKDKTTITLPPACNHAGRILVIKKASSNKYSIKSGLVVISSPEANIDINSEMTIKMNYSSRTLQCDGTNWWLIATKGT